MSEETQDESSYWEFSIENEDGTESKFLELESLSQLHLEPSDGTDRVILSTSYRLQALRPLTLNELKINFTVSRKLVREMAQRYGLISSPSEEDDDD